MTGWRRDDRGVVTAFVAIVAVGLLTAAGLVYDGGQLLGRYRQASDLAGEAARAAAQGVDTGSQQAGEPAIHAGDAEARADAFLAAAGHPGTGDVAVEGDEVTVSVTLVNEGVFLPGASREVTGTATATLALGVDDARPGGP